MEFPRSCGTWVGHRRVVLSAGSPMGGKPRKREPVAPGPCPVGPSLPARFSWSVLTTVREPVCIPTRSDLAHRLSPSGSGSGRFAPRARPRQPGVARLPEGGALTSASLGWELDYCPHPHVQQVIKDCVCLCLSFPWVTPSFERTGHSPLRTQRASFPALGSPGVSVPRPKLLPGLSFPFDFIASPYGTSELHQTCYYLST